jgi:hypothetical protein
MDNRGAGSRFVAKKPSGFNLPLRVTLVALQHLAKTKLIENNPLSKTVPSLPLS